MRKISLTDSDICECCQTSVAEGEKIIFGISREEFDTLSPAPLGGDQDPNIQESREVDTSKLASDSTTPQLLCMRFATPGANWELGAATH